MVTAPRENRTSRLLVRNLCAVRAARQRPLRCRLPLSGGRVRRGRELGSTDDAVTLSVSNSRRRGSIITVYCRARGKFEDAKARRSGGPSHPYTGPSRLGAHADHPSRIVGDRWAQRRGAQADSRRPSARQGASRRRNRCGGIHGVLDQAEGIIARCARCSISAARRASRWRIRTGSGRFAFVAGRISLMHVQRTTAKVSTRSTSRSRAVWDRIDRDEPGVKVSSDGKRRLTAPAYACDLEAAVKD